MKAATKVLLFLSFITIAAFPAFSQSNQVQYTAKSLKGGERDGKRYQLLKGNTKFKQNATLIYCDSAYFFKDANYIEAYGHVRIIDSEDGTTITSDMLFYDGNTKVAKLRDHVIYTQDSLQLFTDILNYDKRRLVANFYEGGKLVDTENTLTSVNGTYIRLQNQAEFHEDVVLVSPTRTITTDNLFYNTETKIAETEDSTKIVDQSGNIVLSPVGGVYETITENSSLTEGTIETPSYILSGDILELNQLTGYYTAQENVRLLSKENDVIILGDEAEMIKEEGITKIYGHALLKKAFDTDTLFLSADTLISIDQPEKDIKIMLAYPKAKIYKSDFQGKADSLRYDLIDSVLYFFQDPVLWAEGSQMLADTVYANIKNNDIDKVFLKTNSFVIAKDSLDYIKIDSLELFDQIKGRDMTVNFKEGQIDYTDVMGNGESIYYALDNFNLLIGMNRMLCSDMRLRFKDSRINNISAYVKPEATFFPPFEINEPDSRLGSFAWRIDEQPGLLELLQVRNPELKEEDLIRWGVEPSKDEDETLIPTMTIQRVQKSVTE